MMPNYSYEVTGSHEVNGRQGVCAEGDYYWVSGSKTLAKYDKDWKLVAENKVPFKTGYELEANHIGDIDVYNNELYIGAEYFMDGVGKNIQIAVYDGDTLELKRVFPFEAKSGQLECSGIAVNPDDKVVSMCSWVGEESGRYLYNYELESGKYIGKVHLQMPPQWLQGVAYYDGYIIKSEQSISATVLYGGCFGAYVLWLCFLKYCFIISVPKMCHLPVYYYCRMKSNMI